MKIQLMRSVNKNAIVPTLHKIFASITPTAYTSGPNIYFKPGAYDPNSAMGIALIGHEVLHSQQYAELGSFTFKNMYMDYYNKNIEAGMSSADAYRNIPFEIDAYNMQDNIFQDLYQQFLNSDICQDSCGN
jgi:hypothetical protein